MANVLIFDKNTKKIKQYIKSAHTPDYKGRDDVLINPDLPDTDITKLKITDKNILVRKTQTEISQDVSNEQNKKDTEIAAKQAVLDKLGITQEELNLLFKG